MGPHTKQSKMKRTVTSIALALSVLFSWAQEVKWYNPLETGYPTIQNQAWPSEKRQNAFDRLPLRAQNTVRNSVWGASRQSAGLCISFTTNATKFKVKYVVRGGHAMPHMPATGVSGIDVYTFDRNGKELWVAGNYVFGDTCVYTYGNGSTGLNFDGGSQVEHTYTLYLPLYNGIELLNIGVSPNAQFRFEGQRKDKPIVAYGTSICQGACASRPGMAWTNQIHRRLDRPVINLGFSGNAFFESCVINLLAEIDAKVYIMDALPNAAGIQPREALIDTIAKAVRLLRNKRPNVPILLVDHLGYPHGETNGMFKLKELYGNKAQQEAYHRLLAEGITDLHYLSTTQLSMSPEATVEGIHPSDYGMVIYANAYERKLREILKEPLGERVTTRPVRQSRDNYNWMERHHQVISTGTTKKHFKRAIIGNSIIHHWGGSPAFDIHRGEQVWNQYLGDSTLNLGFGWDRIENVLWRVYHDELNGWDAEKIFLKIGTNNLSVGHSDSEILDGLQTLIEAITLRQPKAQLILLGILPRKDMEARIKQLNVKISNLCKRLDVEFRNPGIRLLQGNGLINPAFLVDGLHPNNNGYLQIVRDFL